jgi:hypothetical protein
MIVLLLALSACSPVKLYAPPEAMAEMPQGQRPQSLDALGLENHRRLMTAPCHPRASCDAVADPDYETPDGKPPGDEWQLNKDTKQPPQLCLALSGGGLRSATFTLGVLKGLHEAELLKDIDVASSVSGGGYALSWYVAQKFHGRGENAGKGVKDDMLFALGGKWQQHLRRNSEFFTAGHASLPLAIAIFPGIPLNLVANGLFGLHMNASFLYNAYAQRLQQVYHSPPCEDGDCPLGPDIDMVQLAGYMKQAGSRETRPPLFIFNSTALIDESAGPQAGLLQNTVFEFTPFQYGSAALGRYQYRAQERQGEPLAVQRTWSLHEIVAFSGAALDFNKQTNHPSSRQMATALNVDLGRYIPNPRLKRSAAQIAHWISPLTHLAGRPHYARDADGTHIYLSDGGHSENLGVFSLVRRLCREIIIVDAEEDPGYGYDAYFRLKGALEREMGAELHIAEIENRRRAACGSRIGCDGAQRLPHHEQPGWREAAERPLATGEIRNLPYRHPDHCPSAARPESPGTKDCATDEVQVHYLKLAYYSGIEPQREPAVAIEASGKQPSAVCDKRGCADELEESLRKAFWDKRKRDEPQAAGAPAPFPQLPTRSQWMSPEHFDAYRNLGCRLALGPVADAIRGGKMFDDEAIASKCLDKQSPDKPAARATNRAPDPRNGGSR